MGDFGFGGFDFGDLFGDLEGLLNDLIQALVYIWDVLVAVANWLLSALVDIANVLVSGLSWLVNLLKHLWYWLYETILQPIIGELIKIEKFLKTIFGPILKVLLRLRAWWNQYIGKYLLLANQIISRIRQFLTILRLFHVAWAEKLDADFALVQSYINDVLLTVQAALNSVISWLQLVTDPTQILRKAFWQTTAFSGFSEIYSTANLAGQRPVSAQQQQQSQENLGLMAPATPPIVSAAGAPPLVSPAAAPPAALAVAPSAAQPVTLDADMLAIAQNLRMALIYYNPTVPGYVGPEA